MDKRILALVGLLALTVYAVAEESTTDDSDEEQDRVDVLRNLIGDTSSFPAWLQQLINNKIAAIEEHMANRPEGGRRGPPRRRGPRRRFFVFSEEDLEGIDGIPEWFRNVINQLKNAKKDRRPGPPPSEPREPREPIVFGDDVPEWFKTFFEGFRNRLKALRESRRDQRPEGGDGSGRRGPGRRRGPPRRRGERPQA